MMAQLMKTRSSSHSLKHGTNVLVPSRGGIPTKETRSASHPSHPIIRIALQLLVSVSMSQLDQLAVSHIHPPDCCCGTDKRHQPRVLHDCRGDSTKI